MAVPRILRVKGPICIEVTSTIVNLHTFISPLSLSATTLQLRSGPVTALLKVIVMGITLTAATIIPLTTRYGLPPPAPLARASPETRSVQVHIHGPR